MNTVLRQYSLAGLVLLAAGSATAAATVTYADPEHFRDMPFQSWERERVLKELSAHFDKLAAKLPAGQDLKVEVLDVDLAGELRPNFRGNQDMRIMKGGADWPHMHLRYTIEQDGKVIKSGDSRLSDMNYMSQNSRYFGGDFLRYEKKMLDEWFKETVAVR